MLQEESDALDKGFQNVLADMFENFFIVRLGKNSPEERDAETVRFRDGVRLLRETLAIAHGVLEMEDPPKAM